MTVEKMTVHKALAELKLLDKLLDGQLDVTDELARKIANVISTSAAFWVNLQMAYNEKNEFNL